MRDSSNIKKYILRAVAVLLALLAWQLCAGALGQKLLLASPLDALKRLWQLMGTWEFYLVLWRSFAGVTGGFLLALCIGGILAALAGKYPALSEIFRPGMAAVKAAPVVSFIIIVLWLIAEKLTVAISMLMALPIVYENILSGIGAADKKLIEAAKVFRASWGRRMVLVWLPELRPYLLSACSSGLGLAFKAGIAAEVIGVREGSIGEALYEAKVYFSSGDLFAWTLAIVVLSALAGRLMNWLIKLGYRGLERL